MWINIQIYLFGETNLVKLLAVQIYGFYHLAIMGLLTLKHLENIFAFGHLKLSFKREIYEI